ncbi:MAG: DUF1127 domain-containing protein [Pseudomonadota bacterium]
MAQSFTRTHPTGLSVRTSLKLGNVVGRFVAWNDARRTRNALAQLGRQQLEDIGLVPGDIDRITDRRF